MPRWLPHVAIVLALTADRGARADLEEECSVRAQYSDGPVFVGSIEAIGRTTGSRPLVRARVEKMLVGEALPEEISFRGSADLEKGRKLVIVLAWNRERAGWDLVCTEAATWVEAFASNVQLIRSHVRDSRNLESVDVSALRRDSPYVAVAQFLGGDELYSRLKPLSATGETVVAPFNVERWIAAPGVAIQERIEVDVEPAAGEMVTMRTKPETTLILFLRKDPVRGRFAFVDPKNGILPAKDFLGQVEPSQAVHPPR
jgi:hypothetical protein